MIQLRFNGLSFPKDFGESPSLRGVKRRGNPPPVIDIDRHALTGLAMTEIQKKATYFILVNGFLRGVNNLINLHQLLASD